MPAPRYLAEQNRIENLISIASETQDLVQGALAQHVCVVISGFLENLLKEVLETHTQSRANETVSRYVDSSLSNFQNPKWDKIKDLLNKFSETWGKTLDDAVNEPIKDAVNSIVAVRHNIAHGKPQGISLGTVTNYFGEIKKLPPILNGLVN
jgi:hypothetical protein